MLSQYRCLDVCDEKGFFAGKLLGDLGADIIKIEEPTGDSWRKTEHGFRSKVYSEKNLYWQAFNVNKRSVTLNIEIPEGQDIFRKLVSISDVVIESFQPGYLDQFDLSYDRLRQINPKIILTSVTPFGQEGPYRDFITSDLVSMSMGGISWLMGDADRPPVTVGAPQAFLFAGAYAVIATLIALYYREMGGEGQHVEISIQQCLAPLTLNTIPHWTLNRRLVKRAGNRRSGLTSRASQRQTWKCKDGYVTLTIYGGARGAKTNYPLVNWMNEKGMATDYLREKDWSSFDLAKVTSEDWKSIETPIASFFMMHTRAELFEEAVKRGIMLFPAYELEDLLSDTQLKARGFWVTAKYPELRNCVYPGAFAKCSDTDIGIRRPAPAVGEHNLEVYQGELNMSEEHLLRLKQKGVI